MNWKKELVVVVVCFTLMLGMAMAGDKKEEDSNWGLVTCLCTGIAMLVSVVGAIFGFIPALILAGIVAVGSGVLGATYGVAGAILGFLQAFIMFMCGPFSYLWTLISGPVTAVICNIFMN